MKNFFHRLMESDTSAIVMAGALGGLVRWLTLRSHPVEGLTAVIVGAVCALYIGPLALPLIQPVVGAISPEGDASGLSSFLVGLGGVGLTGLLLDIMAGQFIKRDRDE